MPSGRESSPFSFRRFSATSEKRAPPLREGRHVLSGALEVPGTGAGPSSRTGIGSSLDGMRDRRKQPMRRPCHGFAQPILGSGPRGNGDVRECNSPPGPHRSRRSKRRFRVKSTGIQQFNNEPLLLRSARMRRWGKSLGFALSGFQILDPVPGRRNLRLA